MLLDKLLYLHAAVSDRNTIVNRKDDFIILYFDLSYIKT